MMDGSETGPRPPVRTLGEIGLWQFAPYLMNRIMGRYNANVQSALKAHGLTTVKMRTLAILAVVPGLTINELSVYAVTEQSTMSRTLESLEAQGFVRRSERATDGRVREINLTDEGRALFETLWPIMHDGYSQMMDGIGDEEQQVFLSTLQKILNNVRQHDF